ncbi:MAG: hypothetical protein VX642_07025 [Bdellovibrionota bacterium]|nr:hypothetical protein [Bdellovibrionota bacterium]
MKNFIFILCLLLAGQFTYADDYSEAISNDTQNYIENQLGRALNDEEMDIVKNLPEAIYKLEQSLGRELSQEQYYEMRDQVLRAVQRIAEEKAKKAYAEEQLERQKTRPKMNNDFDSVKTRAYRELPNDNYIAVMICGMLNVGLEASTEIKTAGFSAGGGVCINLLALDVYSVIFVAPNKAINAQLAGSISALIAVSDTPGFDGRYEGIRAGFSFKLGAEGGYYSDQETILIYGGVRGGWGFMVNDSPIELHRIAEF